VPGAQATEAELLAFTAERVDEAVARPRWVHILGTMPVTNVGKIFKPELRLRAACHTVAALVDAACAELGVEGQRDVLPDGDNAVRVVIAGNGEPAVAEGLKARLDTVLAPLPIRTSVEVQGLAAAP
jgi:fatty-acyl-CoA synthase